LKSNRWLAVAAAATVLTLSAQADLVYTEINAGPLPASAELIPGPGPLKVSDIDGMLTTSTEVDMYQIYISDPVNFSAMTLPVLNGAADTELFLFNLSGLGIYANDDISGSNTLSCLPSAGVSNPCPVMRAGLGPLVGGYYLLAVAESDNQPYSSGDPSMGTAQYIFTMGASTDLAGPDSTMGGGSPVIGWDGNAFTNPLAPDRGLYDIELTGVTTSLPEPSSFALLLGGAGLIALRKKLA
jgi:hypothetical protein